MTNIIGHSLILVTIRNLILQLELFKLFFFNTKLICVNNKKKQKAR
jgi:hypothetical protein